MRVRTRRRSRASEKFAVPALPIFVTAACSTRIGNSATVLRVRRTSSMRCRCRTRCCATRLPRRSQRRPAISAKNCSATDSCRWAARLEKGADAQQSPLFPKSRQWIGYGMNHLDLLDHARKSTRRSGAGFKRSSLQTITSRNSRAKLPPRIFSMRASEWPRCDSSRAMCSKRCGVLRSGANVYESARSPGAEMPRFCRSAISSANCLLEFRRDVRPPTSCRRCRCRRDPRRRPSPRIRCA